MIRQWREAESGGGRHDLARAEARMQPAISLPMPVGPTRRDQKMPGGQRPIHLGKRQKNPRGHVEISCQKRPHQPSEMCAAGPIP